jgi:predicted O-methyltransferase YrrM
MTPEAVQRIVGDTPHMTLAQAQRLTECIRAEGLRDVLELGFAHGVSTCYLAGALESAGGGTLTTIDLTSARSRRPDLDELLGRCSFPRVRITAHHEPTSYTWRLMRFLEQDPPPRFDLCFLDGAHSWFIDGFAFFLVDRLLRPGGWIVFDDLHWTYESSPTLREMPWVRKMPADERQTPHIRQVFELLVRPHPGYDEFRLDGDWAWARKRRSAP